jgi:hypothetical protein
MGRRQMAAWVGLSCMVLALNASARETTRLDQLWRFKQGDVAGAEQTTLDDKDWQGLAIPHSWGWEDAQQGKNYYRGPGWYRRDLNIGQLKPGRRYFLRFEAAGSAADVYLNGKSLGTVKPDHLRICKWPNVELSPGVNKVEAVARTTGKGVRDARQWTLEPASTP